MPLRTLTSSLASRIEKFLERRHHKALGASHSHATAVSRQDLLKQSVAKRQKDHELAGHGQPR